MRVENKYVHGKEIVAGNTYEAYDYLRIGENGVFYVLDSAQINCFLLRVDGKIIVEGEVRIIG